MSSSRLHSPNGVPHFRVYFLLWGNGFPIEGPVVSLRIRDIFGLGQHSTRPNGVYRETLGTIRTRSPS